MTRVGQEGPGTGRLLPWTGPGGKPCRLAGDGTGWLDRVADRVESVQLGMANDLLGHVDPLLADLGATPEQLRYTAFRLTESLREVHRIARSRGERLRAPDSPGRGEPAGGGSDIADGALYRPGG